MALGGGRAVQGALRGVRIRSAVHSAVAPVRGYAASAATLQDRSGTNAFGSNLPGVVQTEGWEGAWVRGVTPWETNVPSPLLQSLLSTSLRPTTSSSTGSSAPAGTPAPRALVPGCGSGADALAFASSGWNTTGVDISETAVQRCIARTQATVAAQKLQLKFVVADFFRMHAKPFDVIFDYTFLTALPPELWPSWRDSMKRLLHPNGQLVTQLFPVGEFEGGPPFAVNPDKFRAFMEANDFECLELRAVPEDLSVKPRRGREYFGRWKLDPARFPRVHTENYALRRERPAKRG